MCRERKVRFNKKSAADFQHFRHLDRGKPGHGKMLKASGSKNDVELFAHTNLPTDSPKPAILNIEANNPRYRLNSPVSDALTT